MATLPGHLLAPDNSTTSHLQNGFSSSSSSSFACLFSPRFRRNRRSRHALTAGGGHARRYTTRQMATSSRNAGGDLFRSLERLDRRDVVLGGLGGLAGLGLNGAAVLAEPIRVPDLSTCKPTHPDDDRATSREVECCPPFSDKAVEFTPTSQGKVRSRPAAHGVDQAYIEKFEEAIRRMKNLPGDDPRNFYQQARVHCAYCNDAYEQMPAKQHHIQVHNSWLFFPWHRIYLYFYERILGSLINDDTFAMPFWNWDHPKGMYMPAMYTNPRSPLYGPNRDQGHLPPTTIILDYKPGDADPADRERQVRDNLATMHRSMITNGKTAELFMGAPYRNGMAENPGPGSLELTPHNNVHNWTGNPNTKAYEDMGNFYSAARDPLFFAHHANVDRMWYLWNKELTRKNFDEPDFLDAAFLFYDDKKQLVTVKVSQALDTESLGYTYEPRELPWRYTPPVRRTFQVADRVKEQAAKAAKAEFPLTLSSVVTTVVKRPKASRSDREKAAEEEVLFIRDIELDPAIFAKFDVFVNAPETGGLTPSAAELAGSFSTVPHKKKEGATEVQPLRTNLRLALTDLLKEIGADDDESIVVTLVPRAAAGEVKIGGVDIRYIKIK